MRTSTIRQLKANVPDKASPQPLTIMRQTGVVCFIPPILNLLQYRGAALEKQMNYPAGRAMCFCENASALCTFITQLLHPILIYLLPLLLLVWSCAVVIFFLGTSKPWQRGRSGRSPKTGGRTVSNAPASASRSRTLSNSVVVFTWKNVRAFATNK